MDRMSSSIQRILRIVYTKFTTIKDWTPEYINHGIRPGQRLWWALLVRAPPLLNPKPKDLTTKIYKELTTIMHGQNPGIWPGFDRLRVYTLAMLTTADLVNGFGEHCQRQMPGFRLCIFVLKSLYIVVVKSFICFVVKSFIYSFSCFSQICFIHSLT